MDENMQPLAVYNEKPEPPEEHRAASHVRTGSSSSLSREELFQKQREQQQLHYQQSQELLRQHQQEKEQLEALHREGRIAGDSKAQLSEEMEHTHQKELMELQSKHESEQSDMMDLIFESASVSNSVGGKRGGGATSVESNPQPPEQAPTKESAASLWSRATVANVAARGITEQATENDGSQSQPTLEIADSKATSSLWSRLMGTAEDTNTSFAEAATPPRLNTSSQNSNLEEQKKEELKAVMRDRSIPKDERVRRMAEIKERYASSPAESSAANVVDPKLLEKRRREEVQAVMKDRTLGNSEKQARLADIKAKYNALLASSQSPQPTPNQKAPLQSGGMWNSVAANAIGQVSNSTSGQAPQSPGGGSRWNRMKASAFAANTFNQNFTSMKKLEGSVIPVAEYIGKLKRNDPSLQTILLDGRKNVSNNEWSQLFDALEGNAHLTHLSLVNCSMDDDKAVPLVLALVENETLVSLDLSNNPSLTSVTGRSFVKVLKQSNAVLKTVVISGTSIAPKTAEALQSILDDRDEVKVYEKMQAARQNKIQQLLAFSASDEVSPSSARLSQRLLEIDKEDGGPEKDAGAAKSVRSASSASSGEPSRRTKSKKKSSTSSSVRSNGSGGGSRSTPSKGDGAEKLKGVARTTLAARQMANMGGDITNVGADIIKVKEQRKLKGECETCGQKCFNKTMFKSTPITVPHKVLEGRCLRCNPM